MWIRNYLVLLIFVFSFIDLNAQEPFITTWQTDNPGVTNNSSIRIPGTGDNYVVEWEEVDNSANSGSQLANNGHNLIFPSPGTYRVTISGNLERIEFNDDFWGGDKLKLLSIEQWGDIQWTSMEGAFSGCSNMVSNATDVPDLSLVSSTANMFSECTNFTGDISGWDVANVTDMQRMFFQAISFNQPIGDWDVSNVINMQEMFRGAESFSQPLGEWDVANVENMNAMFRSATSFDQQIGDWDVSKVATMGEMFMEAESFNQPIGNWDVSSVTDMSSMFWAAESFNQPIGDWDVSNVGTMYAIFWDAESFNQPIEDWDVSSVTEMESMFRRAVSFNQPIGNWDVSSVTEMSTMFSGAISFNQPIGDWDVSNVRDMSGMFTESESFNQPIGNWDVSNVISMAVMFRGAVSFNQPIGQWDVSKVMRMHIMFKGAVAFNQPIGNWDVSNVTNMREMFREATTFNQPIETWDVSKVAVFYNMFEEAVSFNQPIGNWDVSSAIAMHAMFMGAESFDQNLGGWDISSLAMHLDLNLNNVFDHSGMSCKNYDLTLKGWNSNPTTPDSLIMGAAGIAFHDAVSARDSLINEKGWIITGDEFVEECIIECEIPTPTLSTKSPYPACKGDEVLLKASVASVDGVEYTWFKDGQPLSGQHEQELVVTEEGFYSVIYKDDDNCESEESDALEVSFLDDKSPPVLLNEGDAVLRSTQPNCRGFAFWEAEIEVCGDLSEIEKRSLWRLDLHNTGEFDIISTQPRPDGSLRDNLRIEEELPFGTHRVQWEIRDEHGNVVIEEQLLTLVDMNPPTPVCLHGISTNLSPNTGAITLPARVFDVNSWDDCTASEDLHFSFSSDLSHTHHTWNCDDLDGESEVTFIVEIWVTNEDGHQNHCVTYLKVQDNREVCPNSGMLEPTAYGSNTNVFKPTELPNSEDPPQESAFLLHNNYPNPFNHTTTIDFELPETGPVHLSIYNSYGGKLYHQSRVFPEGKNEWQIEAEDLPNSGFYLYRLGFDGEQLPGRMIKME